MNKLQKYENKKKYLKKHPSKKNKLKLKIINKKIRLLKKQKGGNIDLPPLEPDSPSVSEKVYNIDSPKIIAIEDLSPKKNKIKQKNSPKIKKEIKQEIKESMEKRVEENKEGKFKKFLNKFKGKTQEEKQIELDKQEMKYKQEYPEYKTYKETYNGDLSLEDYKKTKDFIRELLKNAGWEEFFDMFENIFIENHIFFKETIFDGNNEDNLNLFLTIIKYFLFGKMTGKYQEDINKDDRIKKLKELQKIYPEIFNTKTYKKTFWSFIGFGKKNSTVKSFDIIGKKLIEENKGDLKNSIKISEIFPEFIKNKDFCSVIENSEKLQDILHLLPHLESDQCNINWEIKFNKLIKDTNIPIEEKNQYIILFIMSIPNLNKIPILLKKYRYEFKDQGYYILQKLLAILNYDKEFMDNIKDKKIKEIFDKRIDKLIEHKGIYDELWYWILKYAIKFDYKIKKDYVMILSNYFNFAKSIYDDKKINFKKEGKDLSQLRIQENMLFILKNIKEKNKIIHDFIKFINANSYYFDDLVNDKKFNVDMYKLIRQKTRYTDNFRIKSEKLNESNLQDLVKIKFHLGYTNFDSQKYQDYINKIEGFKYENDIRKIPANIYIKIRGEINNKRFDNLLFYKDLMLSPEKILKELIFMLKDKVKKEEETKENNIKIKEDFNNKEIDEKIKDIEGIVIENEENIQNLKILSTKNKLKKDKKSEAKEPKTYGNFNFK